MKISPFTLAMPTMYKRADPQAHAM